MAKKRDRRPPPNSARRKPQSESDHPELIGESHSDRKLSIIFVIFFIISPAISVLVYYRITSNTNKQISPSDASVYERGLVKTDIFYQEILAEHSKIAENTSLRHYDYPVLAYITPWNSRGYDMAKKFNSKFTHLSPVWYDLKSQGSSLVLEGRHNADLGWISELRMNGKALVLPRVVLEASPADLLRKKSLKEKAIDLIVTECKEMGYDGIVLESWSRWAAHGILHDADLRTLALQFIKQLANALHSESKLEGRNSEGRLQLVYVIGPPHSESLEEHDFGPDDMQSLVGAVDGFSLMTYDYSGHNPGPNAPLKWIISALKLIVGTKGEGIQDKAGKIYLGMNFYGYDFSLSGGSGGGAITGRDYLSLLEKYKPVIRWENNSAEHFSLYTDDNHIKHAVFYPTLNSISTRLELARVLGTGISIWEIGQGLDYFFDLL